MRHFIIIYNGKEGTNPLVRLLDNFAQISVVHQVNNPVWEPFDHNNCGSIALHDLEFCLDHIFGPQPIDMDVLNRVYMKTAKKPLAPIDKSGSVGFKMRFKPPETTISLAQRKIMQQLGLAQGAPGIFLRRSNTTFRNMMMNVLKKHRVVVLFAIRQDIFRWALSMYHGDGTGRTGNLQFKVAKGQAEGVGKIHVDTRRLERILARCEQLHATKRRLVADMRREGLDVHPILYEDFLSDRERYFADILRHLEIAITPEALTAALERGAYFRKVHGEIADFVENHQEVTAKFANRFIAWQ